MRALLAAGRFPEARAAAEANPDPTLAALGLAEVALARGDRSEARRSLDRAEARLALSFAPTRAVTERLERVRLAVEEVRTGANEEYEGSEP